MWLYVSSFRLWVPIWSRHSPDQIGTHTHTQYRCENLKPLTFSNNSQTGLEYGRNFTFSLTPCVCFVATSFVCCSSQV